MEDITEVFIEGVTTISEEFVMLTGLVIVLFVTVAGRTGIIFDVSICGETTAVVVFATETVGFVVVVVVVLVVATSELNKTLLVLIVEVCILEYSTVLLGETSAE